MAAVKKGDISGADEAFYGASYYCGFSLRSSNPAEVRIHDGTDNTGPLLEVIDFVADESKNAYYEAGIEASGGIYVDIVSGTVTGSIRYR